MDQIHLINWLKIHDYFCKSFTWNTQIKILILFVCYQRKWMNSVHQQYIIVVPISVIRLPLRFRCWGQLFFSSQRCSSASNVYLENNSEKDVNTYASFKIWIFLERRLKKTAFKSKTNLCKSYLVAIFKVIELIKVVPFARF